MTESAAPLAPEERAGLRYSHLVALHAQQARLGLQIRQETAALVEQDTAFALRSFVADELSMALGESPKTCARLVEDARLTVAFPRLMQHAAASIDAVLAPGADGFRAAPELAGGVFGLRHVDAVLDELTGASAEVCEDVLDLVLTDEAARTPHQLRKATRAARMLHDLSADRDKQDRIHDRRDVRLLDETDGSSSLFIGGKKTLGAEMLAAIDAHVAVPAAGDTRTLGQRRYDFVRDLILGRVEVTASWQALIVVSLETLEGGDAPAEIPGLGLVSAQEAREVLARADLRRAVVDAEGRLVALDDTVLTGDQTPLAAQPTAEVTVAAGEEEPALLDDAEPVASLEEWAWLATVEPVDAATDAFFGAQDTRREAQLMLLCQTGLAQLADYLRDQALASVGHRVIHVTAEQLRTGSWLPPDPPDDDLDDDPDPPSGGSPHGPGDRPGPVRPGGDGRGTPTTPPTHEGTEPSRGDRDWLANREDQTGAFEQIDELAHDVNGCHLHQDADPTVWAPSRRTQKLREQRIAEQARHSRWTTTGLRAAVTTLRTSTPSPIPTASKGYPFRGRLARWIKTRDLTCTFPGCTLQAQRCQLDHVIEYPTGATEHTNGALECVHHHQCKHACMTVTRLTNGTMRWTNRFSVTLDRGPRPLLPGW